jgi:hypothetical protein
MITTNCVGHCPVPHSLSKGNCKKRICTLSLDDLIHKHDQHLCVRPRPRPPPTVSIIRILALRAPTRCRPQPQVDRLEPNPCRQKGLYWTPQSDLLMGCLFADVGFPESARRPTNIPCDG